MSSRAKAFTLLHSHASQYKGEQYEQASEIGHLAEVWCARQHVGTQEGIVIALCEGLYVVALISTWVVLHGPLAGAS